MVLTAEQRAHAMRRFAEQSFVAANETANLSTDEIILMIGGIDDFIEANAAAINSAIPLVVRSKATLAQKALAVAFVAMKRGGVI